MIGFINGIPVITNLQQAANYNVNIDKYEMVSQSLYDSAAYPTTGINQMTFFQLPIGSGAGVISGLAKTAEDTNTLSAGGMPAMQAYIVTSIELDIQPAVPAFNPGTLPSFFGAIQPQTTINDIWRIRATGYLQFTIGSKAYMTEGPLMKFPASDDLEVDAASSNESTPVAAQFYYSAYAKAVGPAYEIAPNNLLLIPNQNFAVTCNWATLAPVATAARIFCRLMGTLIRAAQ